MNYPHGDFVGRTGIAPDTRVLISRVRAPDSGGQVVIAPDALGRSRRLVFLSWGSEERAIDLDTAAPLKGWRKGRKPTTATWAAVEAMAKKLKADTIPVFYDGPADSVPADLLTAEVDEDVLILWRPWREGPWRPYEGGKNVKIRESEAATGRGDVGGGGGDEPHGDGGTELGHVAGVEGGAEAA